jgi:signal transduction histidine kinase/ActR/RegA family two-component response regulator
MQSGRMDNAKAIRIQKALALGAIEGFVEQNRLGCNVFDMSTGAPLLRHEIRPRLIPPSQEKQPAQAFSRISLQDDLYYSYGFDFDPWDWRIHLFKDTTEYAPLVRRVQVAYVVTGLLLLFAGAILLLVFNRLFSKPIQRMIEAIREGHSPSTKGSYELEFLSGSIAGMMKSLEERTAWLERLYYVAITARGNRFFQQIAEAISETLGLHTVITRLETKQDPLQPAACAWTDGVAVSRENSIKGLPCDVLIRDKKPIVMPANACEHFPSAVSLQAVQADTYIGLPIFDRSGDIIGGIHVFGPKREIDSWDMNLLKTAGQMAAAEFEWQDKEKEEESIWEQMFRAQKLESLGILAGGVAHDFNNLLMGVQGRASLMLMNRKDSETHVGHLKAIEEYVQSATGLTRQLLGFARGGKYHVETADMNEVLAHSADLFGRTKKEIRIRTCFEPEPWAVEIDRRQMEQVLLNLFVNAWQAMPGGGDLLLETENVLLDDETARSFQIHPGRYVRIEVTDTGTGMDDSTRERIFDPFFTTKKMGRGTGLGLASAYGIVKHHDGALDVQSEVGKGSTFLIYLPACDKEVIRNERPEETALRGTETVLLVDDESMILDVGRQLLTELGYRVLVAGSGQEALDVYKRSGETIRLVILDMIMPNMSGRQTFEALKAFDPGVNVLLCSGYSLDGQARSILRRGCNGFIQKPFDVRELSRKLRGILDEPVHKSATSDPPS